VINSYPSGTIVVEPFMEDVGLYGASIVIEDTTKPINSLNFVYKVNVDTGVFTPVALSLCTVASGGLSFTISGATAGDFYLYGYDYVGLSSVPSLTYAYATNLKAQVARNTNAISNLSDSLDMHVQKENALAEMVKFTAEGGLAIRLLNKTGGVSVKGEVVTVYDDTAIDSAVEKIVVDVPNPIGVFYETGVADGSLAWVVVSGIADVYFVGDATRGHIARGFLSTDGASYVAGQAMSEAIPGSPFSADKHFYEIGHVIQSRTGAGLAKVVLHFN
jgi:hypothetical protein